jgi:hypothetical protein
MSIAGSMISIKLILINIAFGLSFFPYIKILPIESDVQPVSEVVGILILLLYGIKKDRIFILVMMLISVLIGYSILSVVGLNNIATVVLQFIGYCLPLIFFLALREKTNILSYRLFVCIVAMQLCVGLLQFNNLLAWSDSTLGVIFPNINVVLPDPYGVNLMGTEPAYGGMVVILMLITNQFFYTTKKVTFSNYIIIIIAIIIMMILNKSGTVILFACQYLVVYTMIYIFKIKRAKKIGLTILIGAIITLLAWEPLRVIYNDHHGNVKILVVFEQLMSNISERDLYETAGLIAGKRILTVFVGYTALVDGFGVGFGVASYQHEFMRISELIGVGWSGYNFLSPSERYAETYKPDSYGAQLAMDAGILGIVSLFIFLLFVWRSRLNEVNKEILNDANYFSFRAATFILAGFMILFFGTTTLPAPWLMLVYVYALGYRRENSAPVNKS